MSAGPPSEPVDATASAQRSGEDSRGHEQVVFAQQPALRDSDAAVATLRQDAHLFYLDGSGVLFCERAQALHLLNPTAALVFSLVQEGHDARSAAQALQDLQGLDAATSVDHVDAALAQWEAIATSPAHLRADAFATAATPPRQALVPYPVAQAHQYRLLGTTFRVAFANAEHARAVHPVLAHLEVDSESADVSADIVDAMRHIEIYCDGELSEVCASTEELAPIVKSLIWVTSVNRHAFLLDIHAGVVGNGEACLLLPGAPGSGKSTLTAALVHDGYQLYSDEVALLADGTFDVFPVPLAICVKASGVDALASRFPSVRDLPMHLRADGKRVGYLSPPPSSLAPNGSACRVAALVFPRYSATATTALVQIPAVDALQQLLDECLVLRERLDVGRVERLVTWIGSIPAYRLAYASIDAATSLVGTILPVHPVSGTDCRLAKDATARRL